MEQKFIDMARDFVENEKQFHLGFLPTEQSNPLTKTLEKHYNQNLLGALYHKDFRLATLGNDAGLYSAVSGVEPVHNTVDCADRTGTERGTDEG